LSQSGASGVKGSPQIVIPSYDGTISIIFVNISGVSGRDYIAGLGTYPVFTESIEIIDYHVFNHSFRNKLAAYEVGSRGFEIIENTDNVKIKFYDPSGEYYTISVREVKISAEVAWGLLQ